MNNETTQPQDTNGAIQLPDNTTMQPFTEEPGTAITYQDYQDYMREHGLTNKSWFRVIINEARKKLREDVAAWKKAKQKANPVEAAKAKSTRIEKIKARKQRKLRKQRRDAKKNLSTLTT